MFIDLLEKRKIAFCVIGGLAVNVYAEPLVSLDLDVVIVADKIDELLAALPEHFNIARYANSINITESASDLRIQIQTDSRYQHFISKASYKNVLRYRLSVAAVEDVYRGKYGMLWIKAGCQVNVKRTWQIFSGWWRFITI